MFRACKPHSDEYFNHFLLAHAQTPSKNKGHADQEARERTNNGCLLESQVNRVYKNALLIGVDVRLTPVRNVVRFYVELVCIDRK